MELIEIFFISIGLAMDAFAVSVCKGLAIKKINIKKFITIALYFGIFQSLMPTIGYYLGSAFSNIVEKIDHWIAFILLFLIGLNMIHESFNNDESINDSTNFKTMIILAIATSIDAFTIGITFAFFKVNLLLTILLIGIITFVLSFIGVLIGKKFGNILKKKAPILGGIILIVIGLKILLEHLNII